MLKQRIITALVLVVLAVWALFFASDNVWKAVLLIIGFIAAWEWSAFAKLTHPSLRLIYALVVLVAANYSIDMLTVNSIFWLTLFEAIVLILVVGRYQYTKGKIGLKSVTAILLVGVFASILFVVSLYQFRSEFGPALLLISLFLVWSIDTGAYFSGRRFGKHKLAFYVSPGKTWEGVLGGGILTLIMSLIFLYYLQLELAINVFVLSGLLVCIALFSVFGDLFESVLKRQAGLKDSGSILPGHGGVLDRVDSLIVAVPMLYVLWKFSFEGLNLSL